MILGGTKGVDDWYPHAIPETTDDIIRRTLSIAPEIAPPESRSNGRIPTIDDVKSIVIEAGCGLRPARKGGIRLDVGKVNWLEGNASRSTPLVFNYGYVYLFPSLHSLFRKRSGAYIRLLYCYRHGGYGYQSSWGSARMAVDLLKKILSSSAD